jgi:L-cysteine:1D-myo-inositol 2-amino-2-deoxy-alpha-D-glucopyranoside ligase
VQLFDTALGAVTPLTPRDGRVGMYVCGITPYDGGHLGHAFTYHTFDVIARRLRSQGVTVRSVRNVTDVDDDILRVARARGLGYRELGDAQLEQFDRDMADINLLPLDAEPRATARVPEMVTWIERLVAAGAAYINAGWVYFDVAAHPGYGALSGLGTAAMVELSRQRGADPDDPRKRNPLDFVLWQPSLPDEPRWPSPWSDGRPGWHIECTVLSAAELSLPIDIHGGGDDLIFPHHESEVAQAEAAGVEPYVRHWVHVAMVRYQGEKMSKSLGNLVFVRELLDQGVAAAAVRLLLAAHHHRTSWEYTDEDLVLARHRADGYAALIGSQATLDADRAGAITAAYVARVDDDLDLPGALTVLDEAVERLAEGGERGAAGLVRAADVFSPLLDLVGASFAPV